MRPHMVADTHLLKLLFPTRYYLSLNLHFFYSYQFFLEKYAYVLQDISILHPNLKAPSIHISMNQGAFFSRL